MLKRKLLLADDSITIQKVVNLTFADEGIEVIAVGNGDLAIEKLSEISPDLVMADVHMPGLNGYQVCEKIRESQQFKNVPVILLVGSFEPFDEEEARRVGADDFLTKPFQSIRQLVNKVAVLLSSKNAEFALTSESSNDSFSFPVEKKPTIIAEETFVSPSVIEEKWDLEDSTPFIEEPIQFDSTTKSEEPLEFDSTPKSEDPIQFEATTFNENEVQFDSTSFDDEMIETNKVNDSLPTVTNDILVSNINSSSDFSFETPHIIEEPQIVGEIDFAKTMPLTAEEVKSFEFKPVESVELENYPTEAINSDNEKVIPEIVQDNPELVESEIPEVPVVSEIDELSVEEPVENETEIADFDDTLRDIEIGSPHMIQSEPIMESPTVVLEDDLDEFIPPVISDVSKETFPDSLSLLELDNLTPTEFVQNKEDEPILDLLGEEVDFSIENSPALDHQMVVEPEVDPKDSDSSDNHNSLETKISEPDVFEHEASNFDEPIPKFEHFSLEDEILEHSSSEVIDAPQETTASFEPTEQIAGDVQLRTFEPVRDELESTKDFDFFEKSNQIETENNDELLTIPQISEELETEAQNDFAITQEIKTEVESGIESETEKPVDSLANLESNDEPVLETDNDFGTDRLLSDSDALEVQEIDAETEPHIFIDSVPTKPTETEVVESPFADQEADDSLIEIPVVSETSVSNAFVSDVAPVSNDLQVSDELIEIIVAKVLQRLSDKVVREVAWDVVPELAETIVKKLAEEKLSK